MVLRILHAATEIHPFVRTGGLGDVIAALPEFQRKAGLDVRLVLPAYPELQMVFEIEKRFWVGPLFGSPRVELLLGTISGNTVPTYIISAPGRFDREGNPYLAPDGNDWPDNVLRFGLLSWVAAALARGLIDPDWRADILQAHDWHAALAPAYVALARDDVAKPATILTIHNLAFQGRFPPDTLDALGLPFDAYNPDGFEFYGSLCFMKAGIVYADQVTTVSPQYARDIATPDYGYALEGVIAARGDAVCGILNGVDQNVWDPASDAEISVNYTPETLDKKTSNRQALEEEFGLSPSVGPVLGVVSRLSHQKGIDLLVEALPTLIDSGASLVVVGSGDAELETALEEAASRYPGRVGVRIGFSDTLAHHIYAGADTIVVPSRFEPCGLTQLYALRYGSPPMVRRTGGLADTVVDVEEAKRGTGFVFDDASSESVAEAIIRVTRAFADKKRWRQLQKNAMAARFRWSDAVEAYDTLYNNLRRKV